MIPIATDTPVRRPPIVNYALIGVNVLIFVFLGGTANPRRFGGEVLERLVLSGMDMQLYQFFTYQFLHADVMHIAGNMLFLWVFGNAVNAKMGNWPYLLFYLAGGIFAAVGHVFLHDDFLGMVGASGAIAAVTTAFLALFPRSHVKILYFWILIGTFELPSMILIVFKVVLWDNVIAPAFAGAGNVATDAHLAGYAFGFGGSVLLLLLKLLPRDQFDILALWRRWFRRHQMQAAMADPNARARAQYGRVARPISVSDVTVRSANDPKQDQITELRGRVAESLAKGDRDSAASFYEELNELDPRQVLSRNNQLEVANQLYTMNRLPQAAAAYEKYLSNYTPSPQADEVKLLLGIIYARDLQQYEVAEAHLKQSLERISDEQRREQCRHWLEVAMRALGRAEPKPGT